MAANYSDIKKKKKTSVQQDEIVQTTKSKIKQFLSPGNSQPTQQVKSAPQSPVNPTRRKKVVSVAYLDELQKHINEAPSRSALPSYSGPHPSPRRSRPTPPPPYKSAPNILHPASPTSPSIPPRSTISKKANFKKDKGIYVCPISPPTKGASPTKPPPIKVKSFDNPPQKVSSAPPLRRQDDMTNSLQLTGQGIPISSGNVRKQSAHSSRNHVYDELHIDKSWRNKGGSLSLDCGQFLDDGYEYIDEFKKLRGKQGTDPLYSNVTDEYDDIEDDYDDIELVKQRDSNGYLVLCKSQSADNAEDFEDEDDDPYSYARIDDFLAEKGETVKPSDDKDAHYSYEALHYSQLSI
uniref:Uncharacterized protein n=1 Tax=Amphimedon queenslandica TaxID=400682 RepID=A0A1X7VL45_AMPQE